ncbi:MAG TPA: hypothetical protein DCE78_00870 [Bacteroidetes bacterium]|nr:hypothetical protein [Bacteroidota bacterium]
MIEDFLSPDEESEIVDAIATAENHTSGEIRVHLERKCKGDALDRAIKLFGKLKMHETRLNNGILIYVAVDDHKLAIFGDSGIHSLVGQSFWDEDIALMISHFKEGEYKKGIIEVVHRIGDKLHEHFPVDATDNPDELDNTISFGEGS